MGINVHGVGRRTKEIDGELVAMTNFFGKPPSLRDTLAAEDGCKSSKKFVRQYDAFYNRSNKICKTHLEQGITKMLIGSTIVPMCVIADDIYVDKRGIKQI